MFLRFSALKGTAAICALTLAMTFALPVSAQSTCLYTSSDSDGDGWGWEYGKSCRMPVSKTNACASASSDSDGDGWGWENGRSCRVAAGAVSQSDGSQSNAVAQNDFAVTVQSAGNHGGSKPVGVSFDRSTLRRVGGKGDNWCQTWAADDSVITAMSDGDWFDGSYRYHSRLYRMWGDSGSFSRQEVQGYPQFHTDNEGWYAYGIVSVDGTLYSMVSKTQHAAWSPGPFRGVKMLRSYDN
ncbi:MAG: hypothetical protein AAF404_11840, partial [Pseudomonadota bacterium]